MKNENIVIETPLKKNISVEFLQGGKVGYIHITADCYTIKEYKEVLGFVRDAKNLIPQYFH